MNSIGLGPFPCQIVDQIGVVGAESVEEAVNVPGGDGIIGGARWRGEYPIEIGIGENGRGDSLLRQGGSCR